MFIHSIDPVLFSIGPIEVRYYGLVYAIGFVLLLLAFLKASKSRKVKNLTEDGAYDLTLYIIIGSIFMARLVFELVYNSQEFFQKPWTFFYLWQGGMSFHGGIIGASLAALYYTRKKKISFYEIGDISVIPLALMLGFGRIANFINGELVGTMTNVPWCVVFSDGACRHPSQLYEAGKNFFIFGVLSYMRTFKQLRKGTLFWSFIGMYGLLRFLVSFYREAEYYFFGIGIGQWLSLAMVPIAAFMIFRIYRK